MFWARIVRNKLIGSFRVPEEVKLDSQSYVKFEICQIISSPGTNHKVDHSRWNAFACMIMHLLMHLGSQQNF